MCKFTYHLPLTFPHIILCFVGHYRRVKEHLFGETSENIFSPYNRFSIDKPSKAKADVSFSLDIICVDHLQLHRWDQMCWSSAQRWLHSKHLQLTLEVECLALVQLCTCFIDNLLYSYLYLWTPAQIDRLKNMLSMPNERTHFIAMK